MMIASCLMRKMTMSPSRMSIACRTLSGRYTRPCRPTFEVSSKTIAEPCSIKQIIGVGLYKNLRLCHGSRGMPKKGLNMDLRLSRDNDGRADGQCGEEHVS